MIIRYKRVSRLEMLGIDYSKSQIKNDKVQDLSNTLDPSSLLAEL